MWIITRYIFRETLQTWAAVTSVLVIVIVSNQLAKVLGDAAASQLPRDEVFHVLELSSLQYFSVLIPIGLFLAVLLTLGRLYRDSEMHALMACGYGPARLFRPLGVLAILLALVVGWLAAVVGPAAQLEVQRITREARQRGDLRSVEPGRFVALGLGGEVIYAESVTPGHHLHNVFVQRRTPAGVEVIVADEAWQQDGEEPSSRVLVFQDGRRYEGQPGEAAFRIVEFRQHGIPYRTADAGPFTRKPRTSSIAELLALATPDDIAELQWRLSAPVTLLILVVLAVPLAKASPRQGRFTGLAMGILIYVTYANLLGAARVWVEHGRVNPVIGVWWVHAIVLLIAVWLLNSRFGARKLRIGWRRAP